MQNLKKLIILSLIFSLNNISAAENKEALIQKMGSKIQTFLGIANIEDLEHLKNQFNETIDKRISHELSRFTNFMNEYAHSLCNPENRNDSVQRYETRFNDLNEEIRKFESNIKFFKKLKIK